MAPSAAAVEIRDIFYEIISNNLRYCALCLRNENERKLVEPKSFYKCLCILQLRVPVINTICYVCEAAAYRAVKLFQAINFSILVNPWFKQMSSKLKYLEGMPENLDKYMESHRTKGSVLSGLGSQSLTSSWKAVSTLHDLVQTEVLVVSDGPQESDACQEGETTAGSDARIETTPPPAVFTSRAAAPKIESVVIIDDDDDPGPGGTTAEPPVPRLVPIEQLMGPPSVVQKDVQMISRENENTGFILHPVLTGADGSVYVPTLNALVAVGPGYGTGNVINLVNQGDVIPPPGAVLMQNTQPVDQGSETGQNAQSCDPPTDAISMPANDKPQGAVPPARNASLVSGGRIDWEDKIPMDVISFVDATDPHANQLLSNKSSPQIYCSLRQPSKRKRAPDIIDLC